MQYLAALIILANLTAFFLMGADKRRARKGRWRIPERTLLIVCGLFAAAGGLIGMNVFRHKTQKPKFRIGVPLMLIAQAAAAVVCCLYAGGLLP